MCQAEKSFGSLGKLCEIIVTQLSFKDCAPNNDDQPCDQDARKNHHNDYFDHLANDHDDHQRSGFDDQRPPKWQADVWLWGRFPQIELFRPPPFLVKRNLAQSPHGLLAISAFFARKRRFPQFDRKKRGSGTLG